MPQDTKPDTFTITCKKCGSESCVTNRDMHVEMLGDCKIICLNCENSEFMTEDEEG